MPKLSRRTQTLSTYPVLGESLPLMAPLFMVMLGVLGALYLTSAALNSKTTDLVNAPTEVVQQTPPNLPVLQPSPTKVLSDSVSAKSVMEPVNVSCQPLTFLMFKRDHLVPKAERIKEKVTMLKNWLVLNPNQKLIVEGHTDGFGPDEINLIFSYRRAKVAQSLLIKAGVSSEQLQIKAYGKQELNSSIPADSDQHRRVTVRTDSTNDCIEHLFDGI